jgi:Kef-type K+ transport system membrane component KefB
MTPDTLSASAAILLSLAFSYIPPIENLYQRLTPAYKRLVMLVALLLTAAGSFALACAGFAPQLGLPLTCDTPGAFGLLRALIAALVANQAAYALSPRKGHA